MQKKYNYSIFRKATKKCASRKIAIILGAIIVGCGFIILSSFFSELWEKHDNWRVLFNVAFSTIATVSFASVAWEGIIKYAFSRDVIDTVGISERLVNSGVFAIEESFSDIEWTEILDGAKSITAVFTYSTRWGKDYRESLEKAVKNKCSMIIALPDVNAPGMLDALKYRFPKGGDFEKKITDAEKYYSNLGAEIKHYSKAITNSYYLIDDIGIMAPFNHQKDSGGHSPSVPAIICLKPGFIYQFIQIEVAAILGENEQKDHSDKSELQEQLE